MDDLPYQAEYAKSGRASCRACKGKIAQDILRLAVLVQSPVHDGKVPQWYHYACFFIKQRPKSVGDIANIDNLRWEDQKKIKEKIESLPAASADGKSKKAKKRGSPAVGGLNDFTVEYAKSSRAICRGCEQKILKDEVRISKKDFESDVGKRYGGQDLWHHVECFVKLRDELQFWASGTELPGFKTLSKDDQNEVKEKLPKVDSKVVKDETDGPGPSKKIKGEKQDPGEEKEMIKQNKLIFRIRDQLKDTLKKNQLCSLLVYNKLTPPAGTERILDLVSDILAFGVPLPCKECKNGQFMFSSGVGYQCTGNLTEWVKCQNKTLDPERVPAKIPEDLKETFDYLAEYKFKPRKRVIRLIPPTDVPASVTMMLPNKSEPMEVDGKSKPKVEKARPPLDNMEFVILGKTTKDKDVLKKSIQKLGGKVGTKIHDKVFAVISTQDEVDRKGKRMESVEECEIDVVTEDFIEEVAEGGAPLTLVKTKAISSWGSAPEKRVHEEKPTKSRSGSMFTKSVPDKVKLKLKGGLAVDPDSGLEDEAHVYRRDSIVYSCVLSATDILKGKNSYYKMQVLQSDKGNKFWFFRSWGRIGTTIGDKKLESKGLNDAIDQFEKLFLEKTGNEWANHKNCVKIPGRFFPIDVTYGEEKQEKKQIVSTCKVESNLAKPLQSLIRMLFDVNIMKECMMEFELDLQKMPLGKISSKQIFKAMEVLKDLYDYVKRDAKDNVSGPNAFARLVDGSNRFYTLIPHDFGVETPPVLNTLEQIQTKIEMLESLLELEIAYKMLDAGGDEGDVHPLDANYSKLKAEIEVVEKASEEYLRIEQYLKNSHAETHTQFDLVIEDVFRVKRQGEDRRYKPFKKLHNRQLLWHGSRLTNFVGIISQGLRIAPPEAPACGYMFGKGIYFADRVSKSANYCMTSKKNPTGLMLLCEVALGNMHERLQADYIEKLPKGKHSCKGVGRTQPDGGVDLEDGVHVPLGPAKKENDTAKSLLYNEYIVYDVAQVQMKYLLKVNFKYK